MGLCPVAGKLRREETMEDQYDEDGNFLRSNFANPDGSSALRAASRRNPRNRPCPQCGQENRLTPADIAHHYVCDECANQNEQGF